MARTQAPRTGPAKMPGFTCCVEGCKHNSARDRQFRFYVFPCEPKLRSIWLHNLANAASTRFGSFQPTNGHRVCSAHFKGGRKTYIIRIPTIFPSLDSSYNNTLSTGIIQNATEITGCVRGEISRQIFAPTRRGKRELWDHSYSFGSADSEKLVQVLHDKNKTIAEMDVVISDLQSQLGQATSRIQILEKELKRVTKNMKEGDKILNSDFLQDYN